MTPWDRTNTNILRWRSLYLLVQKAHYKTGNVRKLEASIKVYSGLLQVYPETLNKLINMLLHPFPKIRNQVADVLFVAKRVGKGVNWTTAGREDLKRLKEELNWEGETRVS
jgi:tubulin-specific chaperone D